MYPEDSLDPEWVFISLGHEREKNTTCIGDNAHALTYSPESGESPFSFFNLCFYLSVLVFYVKSLALYWEGLHTSLKPEQALIYLYDGRSRDVWAWFHTGYVKSMVLPTAAC